MFWLTVKVTNTFDGTLLERERERDERDFNFNRITEKVSEKNWEEER